MTTDHVTNAVEIDIHKLPYMEDLYKQVIHGVRLEKWIANISNNES